MEADIVAALANAALVLAVVTVVGLPYVTWVEGRVEAAVSRRKGPNRVGWFGILQPWADTLKLLSKAIPPAAGMTVAAVAAFVPPLLILAIIPFGTLPLAENSLGDPALQLADLHATLIYIVAVAGFAVHGHLLAAWAERSDQSLLLALQSVARSVSSVAALGLTLLATAISYSTLRLSEIVARQAGVPESAAFGLESWGVAAQPLGFLIYLTAAITAVERGREISGAGSVHLLLLSAARRLQLIALAASGVAIYLGAGHLPEGIGAGLIPFGAVLFALKTAFLLFLMSWIRAALSRLGIDGIISFGWKLLVPVAALNVLITAASIAFAG